MGYEKQLIGEEGLNDEEFEGQYSNQIDDGVA